MGSRDEEVVVLGERFEAVSVHKKSLQRERGRVLRNLEYITYFENDMN